MVGGIFGSALVYPEDGHVVVASTHSPVITPARGVAPLGVAIGVWNDVSTQAIYHANIGRQACNKGRRCLGKPVLMLYARSFFILDASLSFTRTLPYIFVTYRMMKGGQDTALQNVYAPEPLVVANIDRPRDLHLFLQSCGIKPSGHIERATWVRDRAGTFNISSDRLKISERDAFSNWVLLVVLRFVLTVVVIQHGQA